MKSIPIAGIAPFLTHLLNPPASLPPTDRAPLTVLPTPTVVDITLQHPSTPTMPSKSPVVHV